MGGGNDKFSQWAQNQLPAITSDMACFLYFLLKYLQIASISQAKISWMNFQPEPMWHFVVLRNFDEKWGRDADFMSPL